MKSSAPLGWVKNLDRILQGEATRLPALREGTVDVPPGGLSLVIGALAMTYGACMGCFALFSAGGPGAAQVLASMLKVPALFFLTLLVTFPSLYVFNALVGSRLKVSALLRLLVASLAVNLAVLASLGPIVAFFSLSTTSYPFMVLLNVVVFTISGTLGLKFLLQTLQRLSIVAQMPLSPDVPTKFPAPLPPTTPAPTTPAPAAPALSPHPTVEGSFTPESRPASPQELDAIPAATPRVGDASAPATQTPVVAQKVEEPSALDAIEGHVLGKHVRTVFHCWVIVFGLVGAQMSWVLRPFIGEPSGGFVWFRPRESSFFESVWRTFQSLLSLGDGPFRY